MLRVYHYTNKKGYDAILKSGVLRPSEIKQGDAYYGSGLYCTERDPSTPFYIVLENNYGNDGGVQNRGADKRDRADYVFAFAVDPNDCVFIETEDTKRSVCIIGGGQNVKLFKASCHGPAQDVANIEQAEKHLVKMLKEDPLLEKLRLMWPVHNLHFLHMDKKNYERFFDMDCVPADLAREVSWVNQTRYWSAAPNCSLSFQPVMSEKDFNGMDHVVVVARDGNNKFHPCFHGDIQHVEASLAKKRRAWCEHLARLESLAPECYGASFLRQTVQLLTDQAIHGDIPEVEASLAETRNIPCVDQAELESPGFDLRSFFWLFGDCPRNYIVAILCSNILT